MDILEEFLRVISNSPIGGVIIFLTGFLFNWFLNKNNNFDQHKYNKILAEIEKFNSIDRFKFEKSYIKKVEIIEKINFELGKALSSTDDLLSTFDELVSSKEPNAIKKDKLEKYKKISKDYNEFSGFLNYAELYLPDDYLIKVIVTSVLIRDVTNRYYFSNLTSGFTKISFIHKEGKIEKQISHINTDDLTKGHFEYNRSDITNRINEIVKLSKDYINNENFKKDFKSTSETPIKQNDNKNG